MAQWFKKLDSQAYKLEFTFPAPGINGRGVGHPVILASGDRGRTSPETLAAEASHIGDLWVWLRDPISMKSGRAVKNYPWHQSWASIFIRTHVHRYIHRPANTYVKKMHAYINTRRKEKGKSNFWAQGIGWLSSHQTAPSSAVGITRWQVAKCQADFCHSPSTIKEVWQICTPHKGQVNCNSTTPTPQADQ